MRVIVGSNRSRRTGVAAWRAYAAVTEPQLGNAVASLRHICFLAATLVTSFMVSPPDFACLLMEVVRRKRHRSGPAMGPVRLIIRMTGSRKKSFLE